MAVTTILNLRFFFNDDVVEGNHNEHALMISNHTNDLAYGAVNTYTGITVRGNAETCLPIDAKIGILPPDASYAFEGEQGYGNEFQP